MTARRAKQPGIKIVRRRLADGTVKTYRYERDKEPVAPVSAIADLCRRYEMSPEFNGLSLGWQMRTIDYLIILKDRLGWMTYKDLKDRASRKDFYELRDSYRTTPYKADKIVSVLSRVLEWGYDRGLVEVNHARRITPLVENAHPRSEIVWTPDLRARFLQHAGPALASAFTVAYYTALRISDLVALRWSWLSDDGWLVVKTSKTGITVSLPVHMLAPLDRCIAGLPRLGERMLTTDRGMPWTVVNLSKLTRECYERAGIEGMHWHDLRGTATSDMLDAGCTDAETKAIIGHKIGGGTAFAAYVKRSRKLAANAYRKWNTALLPKGEIVAFGNRLENA